MNKNMIKLNGVEYSHEQIQKLIIESTSIREILLKINVSPKGSNHTKLSKYIKENDFDTKTLVGRAIKKYSNKGFPRKKLSDILVKNSTGNSSKLKKRLIDAGIKEYKCEKCGNSEYDGEPIPLELHHVNGDHYDNRLENLLILCPICHARTSNFRGKHNQYDAIYSDIAIRESIGKIEMLKEKESLEEQIYKLKKKANGEIPIFGYRIKTETDKRKCPICGKYVTRRNAKYCSSDCQHKDAIIGKISKDELITISQTAKSWEEIGRMRNVTSNAVRKWAKDYNIVDLIRKNLRKNK